MTKMRTSAECCNVWQVRDYTLWRTTTHFCVELPIHTSEIYRNFLYSKKRTPGLNPHALYARDNDEKDGQPLKDIHVPVIYKWCRKFSNQPEVGKIAKDAINLKQIQCIRLISNGMKMRNDVLQV
jgi:hypothetical protein